MARTQIKVAQFVGKPALVAVTATLKTIGGTVVTAYTQAAGEVKNRGDDNYVAEVTIPEPYDHLELHWNPGDASGIAVDEVNLVEVGEVLISGSGAHLITFRVEDAQAVPEPVVGANVSIRNALGTTIVAVLMPTNGSGETTAGMNDGDFLAVVQPPPTHQTPAPLPFAVAGANATHTVVAPQFTSISIPVAPGLCAVRFRVRKADSTLVPGAVCKAEYIATNLWLPDAIASHQIMTDTTDETGEAELHLAQKQYIEGRDKRMRITVTDPTSLNVIAQREVEIPNVESVDFWEIA